MRIPTNYVAVNEDSSYELTQQVQKLIDQGYEPLGGVAMAISKYNTRFFVQAMVKYTDTNDIIKDD